MPVEEEYGTRRQQHAQSPVPASVPPTVPTLQQCPPIGYASDRFGHVEARSASERYHQSTTLAPSERYPLGDRPQTSISSERLAYSSPDRSYHYGTTCPRYTPIGSLDRYHQGTTIDRYSSRTSTPSSDNFPNRNGGGSKSRERYQQYQRYEQFDRFPPIPCPERFATSHPPYMEPPSPAPESTPSPDCFPNNVFPSPTNTVPPSSNDRFIPPPPLSPSPTERYSSPKNRYDRYHHHNESANRYKDRNQYYTSRDNVENSRYHHASGNDRYIPPNAHMPVERYVPQQQESYYNNYHQSYERFAKFGTIGTINTASNSDPYMRRDLAYHYRLPLPYAPTNNQYQRIRYHSTHVGGTPKYCQYPESSTGSSSSSSSVTSHSKEIPPTQCQTYQSGTAPVYHQQEKGTQCGKNEPASPNLRVPPPPQCRHSICASPTVEYVGASGGRHVCATPPPRGSIGSTDSSVCNENCCNATRRAHNSLTVAIWRASASQTPQPAQPSPPQQQRTATPINDELAKKTPQPSPSAVPKPPSQVQRAVSLPVPPPTTERPRLIQNRNINYTQSERLPNRPNLARPLSPKEIIKNYIKKETATFFGVDEENEEKEQRRWLDRRIRMASRAYGPIKPEYRTLGPSHRRTVSEFSGQLQAERPDVLPGPNDVLDAPPAYSQSAPRANEEVTVRRKDSVARMTWDGLSYVVNTLTRHRPRRRSQQSQLSRSFPPDTPSPTSASGNTLEDEVFFEKPLQEQEEQETDEERGGGDVVDRGITDNSSLSRVTTQQPVGGGWRRDPHVVLRNHQHQQREEGGGHRSPSSSTVGGTRVSSSLLDNVLDNSDRRQYGMGWVGRMFGRQMVRKSVLAQDGGKIRKQLDNMEDHRPMFTYWVTTVQILVLFISWICYGFGPFGFDLQSRSAQVLVTSLSLQQVDYSEPANFWYGPRAGDLIHLGAKFAPCMRVDDKISQQIDKIRAKERETACCIRNDDSGCVQSSQADCSKTISKWKKWSAGEAGPGGRISGSVCGLDPKFCDAPASVHPYEWPDDITKWPICRKTNTQFSVQQKRSGSKDKSAEHMICEVIGHPCCIGIHGQCKITTKEYCDFVRGTFHEDASLCSQVSCLKDVCGMLPFYFVDIPDQFYRLWTSLFLHAGIVQLILTCLIQYFLMRDLEKLTGSLRIAIIYIGSGVAGNLASAIFVPYRADVGPAGSQFGLLACLIVEVLNAWPMLKHPNQALCKLLSITFVLFLIGLLPWVDNYAHLFGFVFGFLLSYALLPFISFGVYERRKKIALIWVCLLSAGFLFICLMLLFYIIPVYDCKICSYFNCIPFTRDFCASQNINFKREEPIV